MASDALQSSSWYRVAPIKPRLRSHARLVRHRYRGELWFLLRNPVGNRTHRFTPAARLLIAAMDGQRSVEQLWAMANRQLGDEAPTQDDIIRLLGQLHGADLLQSDVSPDAAEVFARGEKQQRATSRRAWLNPLAVRLPLWNPDAWLNRNAGWLNRIWSPAGGLVWLLVVLPVLVLLPAHWSELSSNLGDRVLAADNLLLLWLVFPLLKLLHEMGHAVAVKRGGGGVGGEVNDMGVMLLVLIPVPYVEASASTVFKSKWERALVGAAGMAVELFIAALAFYGWLLAEPGLARAVLFNVMVVAGISTLVFNGNPLLRYDAYYILADVIEMPNLAQRATRWWLYLAERWLFGHRDAVSPEPGPRSTPRERAWLVFYGLGSTFYRMLVAVAIAAFVATQFFFVGVVLALWALVTMIVLPAVGMARQLAATGLAHQRPRVAAVVLGVAALLGLLLFVLPAPDFHSVDGVVWLPEKSAVRAGVAGRIERVVARPGSGVQAGDLLLTLADPALRAQQAQAQARVDELLAAWSAQFASDRSAAGLVQAQLERERQALAVLDEQAALLDVHAPVAGTLVLPQAEDLPGRHVKRGALLAHVIEATGRTAAATDPLDAAAARSPARQAPPAAIVRVVVSQAAVDLVRQAGTRVQMRLVHRPGDTFAGRIVREVPQAEQQLPSLALATSGGGSLALDPQDPDGRRALQRGFQFDLEMAPEARPAGYGERVHVRFDHASLPLGWQAWRALRLMFLRQFQL